MKIVDVTQRLPEWLRWRAQGVTASEAAIVLGRSPYKTPWRLWAERTGLAREADLSANPHVQRGIAREDWARKAFEERHGTMLLPLCESPRSTRSCAPLSTASPTMAPRWSSEAV
jgi:putative phage-type endonuclease